MNLDTDWEAQHRRTLLNNNAVLERSAQSVARSQVIATETQQIGTEVITELGGQRERLLQARTRLSETNEELDKTRRILAIMKRRVLANKFVLILIIAMEIVILAICVYLKFFNK